MSNKNDFRYNLDLNFRCKIFERCKVLVNDISPVIKELELFIKNILLSPSTGDSKIIYRINSIELYKETKNDMIKEFKWELNTNQDSEAEIIELTLDNIQELFEEKKKDFMKTLQDEEIDFPLVLFGKVFICFADTISDYLNKDNLIEKQDVYNILVLDNNGENNIIY